MKKPIIGISGNILVDAGGMLPGYKRAYVNNDYIHAVIQAGGIPLVIPFHEDMNLVEEQLNVVDGLILSGGHDITPQAFGEEPLQRIGEVFPERDTFDFTLLKMAKEMKLPILGICRGFQIMNVFHGGSMYQDLSYRDELTYKHSQNHSTQLATHGVEIKKDSILYSIVNREKLMVNSFHHQIVKDTPKDFVVSAKASDGVVEAIEAINYPFLLGVQWHPEMMHYKTKEMDAIFKRLIEEASK